MKSKEMKRWALVSICGCFLVALLVDAIPALQSWSWAMVSEVVLTILMGVLFLAWLVLSGIAGGLSARRRIWRFLMTLAVLSPTCISAVVFCTDLYARRSPLFEQAQAALARSDEAQGELGKPWKTGWPVSVDATWQGNSAKGEFMIPVKGARQNGTLCVRWTKVDRAWEPDDFFYVSSDDRKRVDLDAGRQ